MAEDVVVKEIYRMTDVRESALTSSLRSDSDQATSLLNVGFWRVSAALHFFFCSRFLILSERKKFIKRAKLWL